MINAVHHFWNDEDGVISIELLFVVPILVWALLSTFVYFDAYRAEAISTRAGLTIADMISREELPITEDYIDGAFELLTLLTQVDSTPGLRITVFWYDQPNDRLEVSWSYNRGYGGNLDESDLVTLDDRIPRMADLDRAILVETMTDYQAPFSFSIGPFSGTKLDGIVFSSFTVIRPRFVPNFCYDTLPDVEGNAMEC